MQLVDLLEFVAPGKASRVTRKTGADGRLVEAVVHGVKVLGRKSPNSVKGSKRTLYSDKALASAAKLYEGLHLYVDHPDRTTPNAPRRCRDRFGRLQNVQVKHDGVYADHVVPPYHELAEDYLWNAEHDPGAFGFSHNASGTGRIEGDDFLVEDVPHARSVDLVTEPATTTNLFESRENRMPPEDEKKPEGSTTIPVVEDRKPEADRLTLLEQRFAELLEQGKAKDKKIDDLTVELEGRKRAERVEKLLEGAKLPKHAVTPLFKKQLAEAKDEAAEKELLEERKRLAFHQVPGNPAAPSADAGAAIETSDAFLEAVDSTKQRKGR